MLSILIYSKNNVDKLRQTLVGISQSVKYPADVEILVVAHTEDDKTWEAVNSLNLRVDTWVVTSQKDFNTYYDEIYKEAAKLCIGDWLLRIPDCIVEWKRNWDSTMTNPAPSPATKVGIRLKDSLVSNSLYYIVNRKDFIDGKE